MLQRGRISLLFIGFLFGLPLLFAACNLNDPTVIGNGINPPPPQTTPEPTPPVEKVSQPQFRNHQSLVLGTDRTVTDIYSFAPVYLYTHETLIAETTSTALIQLPLFTNTSDTTVANFQSADMKATLQVYIDGDALDSQSYSFDANSNTISFPNYLFNVGQQLTANYLSMIGGGIGGGSKSPFSTSHALMQKPTDPNDTVITINGVTANPSTFSYDTTANRILFSTDTSPTPGDAITITYPAETAETTCLTLDHSPHEVITVVVDSNTIEKPNYTFDPESYQLCLKEFSAAAGSTVTVSYDYILSRRDLGPTSYGVNW